VPRALPPGGTLGIVAPSGPVDRVRVEAGLAWYEARGFRVSLAPHLWDRRGFLAGDDRDRARDLEAFLLDPRVDAVLCARGGYGALRVLPWVDWARVARDPKALVGFSDVTALHLAMARLCVVSFHGPVVEEPEGSAADANRSRLLEVLSGGGTGPVPLPEPERVRVLAPGRAVGRLVGGNLSLLAASLGTPWEVDTRDAIVLLEDVHEPPYRLDRYLTQLELAGKLSVASGFAVGELVACEPDAPGGPDALEVFAERLGRLGRPCLAGLPLGHGAYRVTVPLGVQAELATDPPGLWILESGVAAAA
jgi:muramoyltetrapeptide carboxypeptidase